MHSSKDKTLVETETLTKKKDDVLLDLEVRRDNDGIYVKMQSNILEDFFKKAGKNREFQAWQGHTAYKIPASLEVSHRQMLGYWGHEFLIINGKPNMSFLVTEGLKEGIVYKLQQVCSRGEIIRYTKLLKQEVRAIFVSYMKPIRTGVRITVTTTGDVDDE